MTDRSSSSRPEQDPWTMRFSDWPEIEWSEEVEELLMGDAPPERFDLAQAAADLELPASARLVFPVHYEPTYAYPVILWLHGEGESERSADVALPRISERNYLGVALRGNVTHPTGYGWSTDPTAQTQTLNEVLRVVSVIGDLFPIHQDRIYLAGVGTGGETALQLFLQSPLHFAGVMSLGGQFGSFAAPLTKFRELRGKRVLLGAKSDAAPAQLTDMVATGRLLYSAGLQVATRVYPSNGVFPTPKVLRDLDHWIMASVSTAITS